MYSSHAFLTGSPWDGPMGSHTAWTMFKRKSDKELVYTDPVTMGSGQPDKTGRSGGQTQNKVKLKRLRPQAVNFLLLLLYILVLDGGTQAVNTLRFMQILL